MLDKRRRELTVLERDITKLEAVQKPFPRISYDEAVKRLQAKGLPIQWGGDFGGPDETTLSEEFDRPVMVHRYPAAIKAFYMKPDPERAELALGVDMLAPEGYGEIIGGGERLADLDLLLQRIKEHNLPQEAFEWYLDLRRYGTCRTAASAWASSASCRGSASSITSARRFRIRGCCIGCIRRRLGSGD